ncbi:MAG: FG-GAP-like repeat-containing protein [Pyrinomonadaceae bacterium]
MKSKTVKILLGLLAVMFFGITAQAATFTAATDGDWATTTTWTFTGTDADGIPDADDTVTIPSPRVVTVSGAQSAQNLTVNGGGTLTINGTLTMIGTPSSSVSNSGTVNGAGSLQTQGTTTLNIGGTFIAPLVIVSGTTTTNSSTIGGSISILSGAILQVPSGGFQTFHTGDLTIDAGGTLNNAGNTSVFFANGANIVNNGTVIGNSGFRFGGTAQNLSGIGTFTGNISILSGSTTTLTGSINFGDGNTTVTNFNVNGGGTFAVGGNTLTLNGVGFTNSGTVTSTLGGIIRMQAISSLNIGGTFTAALEINSGTTDTQSSTIGGSISILSGATLQVPAGGFQTTHNGDLTIASGGTLNNLGNTSIFFANGANIVNNGTVIGSSGFRFGRTGAQTLSGTGIFTGNISILSGSTTTLTDDVTFGDANTTTTNFTVNNGGTLTLSGSNTLTLNGVSFANGATATTNGSGTLRTQGTSFLSIGGTFTVPVVIAGGITDTQSSTIGGSISILSGATLQIPSGGSVTTHNGDLTIASGGTLNNLGNTSRYDFNGANIVNNGTVIGNSGFRFGGTAQNLSGTGTFTGSISILSGSTTTLTGDVTFGNGGTATSFNVNGGGTLEVGGNTLILNGVGFTNNGTVTSTTAGVIRTQGTTTLSIGGAFTGSLEINNGTTSIVSNSNIGGSITILNGATLQLLSGGFVITHTGDLTIDAGGILNNLGNTSVFFANGANIVNNGTVIGNSGFRFGGTAQNLSGTGTFTGNISILSGSTTTLTDDVTFGDGNTTTTNFSVNSGGILTLSDTKTLTLNGVGFTNSGTTDGNGTLRTQAATSLSIGGTFTAPLVIATGTSTTVGNIGGSITILNGATLQLPSGGFVITHTGDLTIASGGILNNLGNTSRYDFNGANIVNNGTVSGSTFRFVRTGAQTLSGTGAFTTPNVSILSGSTVTLGSNHQLNALTVNNGGAFNTATFTAFLNGAGTPLTNNGTAINGSFTYNGTAAQTVQTTNVDYTQLGIDNAAGVTLPAAETVSQQVTLINGVFNNGAFLTLANNATIARDNGTLQTVPSYAGNINVLYFGTNTITTGIELTASTTALTNLTINKTGGATVTLDKNPTVNGAATFTGGILLAGANRLIISATGTTVGGSAASYVIGNVQKFNPANGFTFPVGTANGYSPLVLPTASGAGSLTVVAVQAVQPDVIAGEQNVALKRYWTLTETGSLSAQLQFNYLQADVPGGINEANLSLRRYENGAFTSIPATLDTVNNTSTTTAPITDFSDWTLVATAPTAASADLGGRVTRADGSPIAGVRLVSVNSASSTTVTKYTDSSGNYRFEEMPTGATYVITAARRGYRFSPATRVLNLTGEVNDSDFTATRDLSTQEATSGSDFDGDGRADLAVFRPDDGTWYIERSSDNSFYARQFGVSGDAPTAGDYDGDGKADFAVYRPVDNVWYLLRSSDNTFFAKAFGQTGDVPAAGDYDGDGKTDIAVYRPAEGVWYIWQSSSEQLRAEHFGASSDRIVPADYDGDGKTDIAVYRASEGVWYILQSRDGQIHAEHFGVETDEPTAADYDGDGKADVAVYRRSEGVWYILGSVDGNYKAIRWGAGEDTLVPADYDGDGKADVAVFRKGDWYILPSGSAETRAERFGKENDKPVSSRF